MKEIRTSDGNRILVLRGGALGDFILSLPVLQCVQNAVRAAHIEILGYAEIAQLAVEGGLATQVHRLDAARFAPLFCSRDAALRQTDSLANWLRSFDFVVSIWRDPERGLLRTLRRAGVREPVHIEPVPPEGKRIHSVDYMLDQLPEAWRRKGAEQATLTVRPERREWAKGYLRACLSRRASRVIAIHPGSGGRGRNRNWPADRFAAVAEHVLETSDTGCLMIRGPADDHAVHAVQERLRRGQVPICSGLKPVELAALLAEVQGVVGNDSGVTHLAAAVGTRTVAIFGATDSVTWAPRGPAVCVLQSHGRKGGPLGRHGEAAVPGNIEDVKVEDVLAALGLARIG